MLTEGSARTAIAHGSQSDFRLLRLQLFDTDHLETEFHGISREFLGLQLCTGTTSLVPVSMWLLASLTE